MVQDETKTPIKLHALSEVEGWDRQQTGFWMLQ